MLTYKIQYVPPGKRVVTTTEYQCEQPLEPGKWLEVGGIYLTVERVVAGKPGDPYAGIALCKLSTRPR